MTLCIKESDLQEAAFAPRTRICKRREGIGGTRICNAGVGREPAVERRIGVWSAGMAHVPRLGGASGLGSQRHRTVEVAAVDVAATVVEGQICCWDS